MLLIFFLIALFINICLLNKDSVSLKTKHQILVILSFVIVFNFSYIIYYIRLNHDNRHVYMILVAMMTNAISILAVVWSLYKEKVRIEYKRKYNIYLVYILLFVMGSLYLKDVYPLWDSACYMDSLNEVTQIFDYGLHTRLSDYFLCGHISIGYTFFLLVGNFIFSSNAGPIIVQIIGGALSVCAFYETLRSLHAREKTTIDLRMMICTLSYMLSPAVFGLVGDFSTDYGMLILLPILVFTLVKKLDYLHVVVGIMFCMTKEPAIIIYSGIVLIPIICSLKQKRWLRCIGMAIPCFAWLLVYFIEGAWGNGISFSGGTNTFGIDKSYIRLKLLHFSVMNYNWLLLFVTMLLLVIYIFKSIKKKSLIREQSFTYCIAITIGGIGYVIFSCLFVTAIHYRYVMIITYVYIFLISNMYLTLAKKTSSYIGGIIIGLILSIQSFKNIDYFSSSIFEIVQTSEDDDNSIISLSSSINDGIIYNREYIKYLSLIEKGLFVANIDENSVIIIPSGYEAYNFSGHPPHGLYLDYTKKKFASSSLNYSDHLTEWNGRILRIVDVKNINDYDKVIEFVFPWDKSDREKVADYDECFDVTEGRWSATVYVKYNHGQ